MAVNWFTYDYGKAVAVRRGTYMYIIALPVCRNAISNESNLKLTSKKNQIE